MEATDAIQRDPDFIIIGAMKAGTTAMSAMLKSHRDIAMANNNYGEVHYFDNHFNRGLAWYRSQFGLLKKKVVGEKSPSYICNMAAMVMMREILPDVKLVVLLRDPVWRFWSHKKMNLRGGKGALAWSPKARGEGLWRGCYATQLEHVFHLYPRNQVKIIFNETLRQKTQWVVKNLMWWLDVDVPDEINVAHWKTRHKTKEESFEDLAKFYHPHNTRLIGLLPDRGDEIRRWEGMKP